MTGRRVALHGLGYRPAGRAGWALRGIDLTIEPGERVLLLGASGSGKSTLLRAVAGLLDAGGELEGEVSIDGVPARQARHHVGLLLQDPDAHLVLPRAGDDVAFGPQNRGLPPDEVATRVGEALDAVAFPYPPRRAVSDLSGGERQRLALAGVLALRPEVLLLDEPTSMLDAEGAALVRAAVERASTSRGATLVVVEHRVTEWLPLVDRVVVLAPDGVVADGSPQQVLNAPAARGSWIAPGLTLPRRSPSPGPRLLSARGVSFRHRGSSQDAVHDVSVDVVAGSVLAVTGPNGSGKTTLARLLGGLAPPGRGRVTADDALVAGSRERGPHRWPARELAGRIGSVFQNPEHAFLTGSVAAELALGPRALAWPASAVDATVDSLLDRMHLRALASANPFTLSGGEQRRLSVAAAIATRPQVVILDEPTYGQDPHTWQEMAQLIAELPTTGTGVVVVSHDRPFVDALADDELTLAAGGSVTPS